MGNEQARLEESSGSRGISSMDQKIQEKFSKGIQFNMKLIIRGENITGKSALFQRLQGGQFIEAYTPTEEIQVGTIIWGYKGTSDKVKVEIWDVVDKAKPKKKSSVLKFLHKQKPSVPEDENPTLDATFLDVYKGAHGVIFMFDITKKWTWTYVEQHLPKVPFHIPIIILGNYHDMYVNRVIAVDEVKGFIRYLERPDGAAEVRYCEVSMKDCFGLSYLHKFFSIPFLQMQQEMLLQQLQENRLQMQLTKDELAYNTDSVDFNYQMYLDMVHKKTLPPAPPTVDDQLSPTINENKLPSLVRKQSSKTLPTTTNEKHGKNAKKHSTTKKNSADLDSFVPEGALPDDFLGDREQIPEDDHSKEDLDNDVDSDEGNPLVAADEDVESEDEDELPATQVQPHPSQLLDIPLRPNPKLKSIQDVELTESEGEAEIAEGDEPKAQDIRITGDFSFDAPLLGREVAKEPSSGSSSPVKTSKGGGLLLAFDEPTSPQSSEKIIKKKKKKSSKGKTDPVASADVDQLESWLAGGEPQEDTAERQKKKKTKSSKKKRPTKTKSTELSEDGQYQLL